MEVIRQESKIKDGVLKLILPDEFKNKVVEVVIRIKGRIEKKILADKIRIDTLQCKFNREEIYEKR